MHAVVEIPGKACAFGQLLCGVVRIVGMVFAVSVFGIEREVACVPAGGVFQNRRVCQLVQTDLGSDAVEVVQRIAAVPDLRCGRIDKFARGQGLVLGMVENACRRTQQEQPNKKGFHNAVLPTRQRGVLSKRQTCQCGFRLQIAKPANLSPCRCRTRCRLNLQTASGVYLSTRMGAGSYCVDSSP